MICTVSPLKLGSQTKGLQPCTYSRPGLKNIIFIIFTLFFTIKIRIRIRIKIRIRLDQALPIS